MVQDDCGPTHGTLASCTSQDENGKPIINGENIIIERSLTFSNTAQFNLTAYTNPADPLSGVLIYDPESAPLNFRGNSSSTYGGALYFPNADLTWGGNTSADMKCTVVIASTLQFSGDSTIDVSGCPAGIIPKAKTVLLTN